MSGFHVAAVRDWDEDRMMKNLEVCLYPGTERGFITHDYRTVQGLVRHRIQNHILYHSHVWAVFRMFDFNTERFVGLEYNSFDPGLCDLAARYMRVRNRIQKNPNRISAYPLYVRMS